MSLETATALQRGRFGSDRYDEPPDLSSGFWEWQGDPRTKLRFTLATVFVLAAGAFVNIVEDYLGHETIFRWDGGVSRWLYIHSNGSLVSLFKIVTWGGNVAFLAIVVAAAVLWLVRLRRLNEAALVAVSAAGIELLNGGLKLLFHRQRPELAFVHLDTYSFPSGHAVGSSAIYAILFFVFASRAPRPRQIAAALAYVLLVSLVCFSRLYLEAHYLSDVLAGVSLGAAWASASLFVYETKRHADVRNLLPPAVGRLADRLAR
jgi:membrane-associated phospholipid phosphatase